MVKTENKNEQEKMKNPLKPFSFRLSLKKKIKIFIKAQKFFLKNYPKKIENLKIKESLRNENKVSYPHGSF